MEFCDSHCHLDSADFDADRDQIIARAKAAGITRFVTIGASDGTRSAERAVELASRDPQIWASVGLHPHSADQDSGLDLLERLAAHPRVVAIGETGLDFHYTFAKRENQFERFRFQIALAKRVKKPIIIHCREAAAETLEVLKEENAAEVGGVFHCYSGDATYARELFAINFIVSFPGILTFKKSQAVRDAAKEIPLDKVLLETDSPFLAPEPYRGKRCESAFLVETAKVLARIHDVPLETIARVTTENAVRLFALEK